MPIEFNSRNPKERRKTSCFIAKDRRKEERRGKSQKEIDRKRKCFYLSVIFLGGKTITDYSKENPFYHNYIFTKADLDRCKIKWWGYPLLWILPTYVQIGDGWVFYYKRFQGRIYLIKEELLEPLKTNEK